MTEQQTVAVLMHFLEAYLREREEFATAETRSLHPQPLLPDMALSICFEQLKATRKQPLPANVSIPWLELTEAWDNSERRLQLAQELRRGLLECYPFAIRFCNASHRSDELAVPLDELANELFERSGIDVSEIEAANQADGPSNIIEDPMAGLGRNLRLLLKAWPLDGVPRTAKEVYETVTGSGNRGSQDQDAIAIRHVEIELSTLKKVLGPNKDLCRQGFVVKRDGGYVRVK